MCSRSARFLPGGALAGDVVPCIGRRALVRSPVGSVGTCRAGCLTRIRGARSIVSGIGLYASGGLRIRLIASSLTCQWVRCPGLVGVVTGFVRQAFSRAYRGLVEASRASQLLDGSACRDVVSRVCLLASIESSAIGVGTGLALELARGAF